MCNRPIVTSPVIVKCQQGEYISQYSNHQHRVMFVIISIVPYAMINVPAHPASKCPKGQKYADQPV